MVATTSDEMDVAVQVLAECANTATNADTIGW